MGTRPFWATRKDDGVERTGKNSILQGQYELIWVWCCSVSASETTATGAQLLCPVREAILWEGRRHWKPSALHTMTAPTLFPVFLSLVHLQPAKQQDRMQIQARLAADWPASMQIIRLIAQDHMNNKQYVGKADFLVFRTLNQHGFLGQLQEKKLCAVILLPSQTLLMSVSDKAGRLIGMLFPGDMVVFKPQVSSQQQQQLQQSQQHQYLQQQQQQHLQQQQQLHFQQQQQQHQQPQQQQQQQMVGSGISPQHLQMVGSGMTPQQQQQQQQMISSGMTPQQQQMISSGMTPQQQIAGSGMTQQQQILGSGMAHTFGQGPGRSQIMSQVKMPSQGPGNMTGGGFLS